MKTSRRDILGALGLGAVMSPFVPFLHRRAEAQGFPKRLLLVFTGCGSVPDQYWPTGGETDFVLRPGSITEPLAPYRSKLIFPKGLTRGEKRSRRARIRHGLSVDRVQPQPGRSVRRLLEGALDRSDRGQEAARRRDRVSQPRVRRAARRPGRQPAPAFGDVLRGLGSADSARIQPVQDVRPPDARQRQRAHRHHAR